MEKDRELYQVCPNCGGTDFITEPAVDDEGMATGIVLVTCASCGAEIGDLPPLEPGEEAEPAERVPLAIPSDEE